MLSILRLCTSEKGVASCQLLSIDTYQPRMQDVVSSPHFQSIMSPEVQENHSLVLIPNKSLPKNAAHELFSQFFEW